MISDRAVVDTFGRLSESLGMTAKSESSLRKFTSIEILKDTLNAKLFEST
jgi:hypothetical protein